jgi:hypothetical protein
MTPRAKALTIPDSDRYWTLELPEKGEHHFRNLTYGKAAKLVKMLKNSGLVNGGMGIESIGDLLDLAGIAIGLTWWHRAYKLETPFPGWAGDLEEYGDEVIGELQDQGYTFKDVLALVNSVLTNTQNLLADQAEADAQADFTSPKEEQQTS